MTGRVFVVYHKPVPTVRQWPFSPILVGPDKARFSQPYLRDDEGENIADLNPYFNELTALYRVWKDEKLHADYIGLAHYGRFLAPGLDKTYYYTDWDHFFPLMRTVWYQKAFDEGPDAIVPYPAHQKVGAYYARFHDGADVERVLTLLREQWPDYAEYAQAYFAQSNDYLCNLFIFAKPVFLRYCEWLFAVLDAYRERYGLHDRLFISERLTGVFISRLIQEGAVVRHAPIVQVATKAQGRGVLRSLCKKIVPTWGWQCYYRAHFGAPKQEK